LYALSEIDALMSKVYFNCFLIILLFRYGRFRPWHCPLARKYDGWQITWWHYAQEAVLSDVRKKLKKTSWKYFGDRL
jgi:hypothetical protein